ncbi:YjbQ family protein [Synechococcus sp. RSCCF101]|uniref:secondary thiamine-phosphate synthase enzyme YjbQ n=1 Tax=Synechococcus sp. RSCCF101 TaxID=2511069 RepID=UPI001248167A|nr:secondary thiamine-phosphate synthase enzyme YjbQ [Synechococcus sp. RSCCF101]QEY31280.1 YjbQ family protein [Synechococcus sp. RSCCF101]
MPSLRLSIDTSGPVSCHPVTDRLRRFVADSGIRDGLLVACGLHTTMALVVNEMEPRLLMDLEQWLARLAPAAEPWKHNDLELRPDIPADEPCNAHAHLQALLLGNQVHLPLIEGELALGTYQDVILVELDGPRRRQVVVQLQPESHEPQEPISWG